MTAPTDDRPTTPGSLPPEDVEDRPNVGTVKPEDYPLRDRAGSVSDKDLDEDKEEERLNPGSGSNTPAGPASGTERDLA